MRALSARIARATTIRRAVAFTLTVGAAAWGAFRTLERVDALTAAAVGYCVDASTTGAGDSLEGLREGMLSGDDTDGIVYKAALAGFRAQCAAEVANRGAL